MNSRSRTRSALAVLRDLRPVAGVVRRADTDRVTIQIGGNDIGWSRAVTACLGGTDAQCAPSGSRGVNAPAPWILDAFDPGSFHPNAKGYQAYTAALTAAIKPGQLK